MEAPLSKMVEGKRSRIGFATLGDLLPNPKTGVCVSESERFRQFVELGVLAESLGFWSYHLGEHHFSDYVLSSPPVILAAVAERTEHVRLSTAVALLPHRDPVHVAEDYATLDMISGGRVELIAGRGVYKNHYALFGQEENDSELYMDEAVTLLKRLWSEENVSWSGGLRAPLEDVTLRPRCYQHPYPPIWLSASSQESVTRAVKLGCPVVIPMVSTGVENGYERAAQYRAEWAAAGRDPFEARVGLHLHFYVGAGTTAEAIDYWGPHQKSYLEWVISEIAPPGTPLPPWMATLERPISQAVCGSAEDVAAEIARRIRRMGGVDWLTIQCDQGGMPIQEVRACLYRFASDVRPKIAGLIAGWS